MAYQKTGQLRVQWKPLNVITLGQRETDNINRKITMGPDKEGKFDHVNQIITLPVITLSSFHSINSCNYLQGLLFVIIIQIIIKTVSNIRNSNNRRYLQNECRQNSILFSCFFFFCLNDDDTSLFIWLCNFSYH